MTISFPSSPVDQQVYAPGGSAPNYIYSTALGVWQVSGFPYGSAFAPINTPTFVAPVGIGTGGTALTGAVLQATGTDATGTIQIEVQNLSAGTLASTDFVATANDGTDTTNYIDLGINSSGNTDSTFTVAAAHDGYLYTSNGNLAIGTATSGKNLVLFAGGTLIANTIATVTSTGLQMLGVPTAPTATTGTNTTQVATCAFVNATSSYTVATIAALRLNSTTFGALAPANVVAYASVGDGGGGVFVLAISDTTSADNGGTIIVDAASQRWYRQISPSQPINVLWFGAYRNVVTDSTAAFTAALAVTGAIYAPAGKYTFSSSLTYAFSTTFQALTVEGAGSDETILYWSSGNGIAVSFYAISNSVHFHNFSVTTGATGGTTIGINLSYATLDANPANTALSDITGVTLRGDDGYAATHYWNTCINVLNVSNIDFTNVSITGPHPTGGYTALGTGVNLAGSTALASYGVVYNFISCVLNYINVGIMYGTYAQGVAVTDTNFTGGGYAIYAASSEVGLDQLSVTGCQINVAYAGILFNTVNSAIMVSDCLFIVPLANSYGIIITCNFGVITGNAFECTSLTGTVGVELTAGTSNVIVGNAFDGFANAIALSSGVINTIINANSYYGCTALVVNSGGSTNNIQIDLSGVTTLSNAFTPAQIAGIVGTTTNNNAQAGSVGEFISATVSSVSAVALTSTTPANVTSISLTAGDWDVHGTIAYLPTATTSISSYEGGCSLTTAALPSVVSGAFFSHTITAMVPNVGAPPLAIPTGTTRILIATTTTVYLVAQCTFTVSTLGAYGMIGARRVR